jgi:hypothetical protein
VFDKELAKQSFQRGMAFYEAKRQLFLTSSRRLFTAVKHRL